MDPTTLPAVVASSACRQRFVDLALQDSFLQSPDRVAAIGRSKYPQRFLRRGKGLKVARNRRSSDEPVTLIVDSTGLKIHGDNSWHEEKHGTRKTRKTWRKLHIALDPGTAEIAAAELTPEHAGDETALPTLLAGIDADVAQFLADGAYDGQGVADCLVDKFGPGIEIIIPPPKNAVHGANIQRNQHIDAIAEQGRMKWQTKTGYNQRSQVEAPIGRWKKSSAMACKRALSTIKLLKRKLPQRHSTA